MPESRFVVRPGRMRDADDLVARHADVVEWEASGHGGFRQNLKWSLNRCTIVGESFVVEDTETGLPVVIGGANPQYVSGMDLDVETGQVLTWMVVADGGERWGLTIMRDHKDALDGFFSRWPLTECYSDCRNVIHHRWLEYLGYVLVAEILHGPYELPFLHYRRGF